MMSSYRGDAPERVAGLASVIVPAYNVELYIRECLDSILAQTYGALEVLVVDDGSVDSTAAIIEDVAANDSRIRLFRNSNNGVSYSRNFAIDRGRGEYLIFVDADDVVASDYVETLVKLLKDTGGECSAVGISAFSAETSAFGNGRTHVYEGGRVLLALLGECRGFLCNKGYLYSIVDSMNIRLREDVAQSEDMLFNLEYFSQCRLLAYNDGVRYFYRQRVGSATNDLRNQYWFSVLDVFEEYRRRLGSDPSFADAVRRSFLPVAYEGLWRARQFSHLDPVTLNRLDTMRSFCEEGLTSCSLVYRLKMFTYRSFMGIVMRHRLRDALLA